MSEYSYRDLEMKVILWAEARKIIPNSTPLAQARKTGEEVIELVEASAKMALLKRLGEIPGMINSPIFVSEQSKAHNEFRDAVGDVLVTLINACALADVDLVDCLDGAYNEIKDRKGTLMPNGIFVKET